MSTAVAERALRIKRVAGKTFLRKLRAFMFSPRSEFTFLIFQSGNSVVTSFKLNHFSLGARSEKRQRYLLL